VIIDTVDNCIEDNKGGIARHNLVNSQNLQRLGGREWGGVKSNKSTN